MKKLFVSLLRLGDVILQKPLIEAAGLGHEIHILINDEFKQAAELYPQWKFHFFPRKALQTLINKPETSLLAPFEELQNFMTELNRENFQEAINLTHNRISAYLMDQIQTPIKRGLEFQSDRFKLFENTWQSYFNEAFSDARRSHVHYLSALAKSLELPVPRVGMVEDRSDKNTVYFQVLTSDEKKNWSLKNWKALADRLNRIKPEWTIKILCAQFEVQRVRSYFSNDQIEVTTLLETRQKLKSARLLVTGDTSIAHLAAEVKTPTLVLSLGSSDYTKTMPWSHGNWILTSEVPCAPCPHSTPCQRTQHDCAEGLRVSTVLGVINGLDRDQYMFSVAQPENIYRTSFDTQFGIKLENHSILGGQDVSRHADVF